MYVVVGSCPKCGCPIYSPSVWHGVTPPPASPSCSCNPAPATVTSDRIAIDTDLRFTNT